MKLFYTLICFVVATFQINITSAQTKSFAKGNWHSLENVKKSYLGETNILWNCDSAKKSLLEIANMQSAQYRMGYDVFTEQQLPWLLSKLKEDRLDSREGKIWRSVFVSDQRVEYIEYISKRNDEGESEKIFSFIVDGVRLFSVSSYDMALVFQNVEKRDVIQTQRFDQIKPAQNYNATSVVAGNYYGNQNPYPTQPVLVVYRSYPYAYSGVSLAHVGFGYSGYRQSCRGTYYQQNYSQLSQFQCREYSNYNGHQNTRVIRTPPQRFSGPAFDNGNGLRTSYGGQRSRSR